MNLGGKLDINLGGKTHNLVTTPLAKPMTLPCHALEEVRGEVPPPPSIDSGSYAKFIQSA